MFRPDIHFGSVYLGYARQSPRERPQGYSTTAPPSADRLATEPARGLVRSRLDPRLAGRSLRRVHRGLYSQSGFFAPGCADAAEAALRRTGGGFSRGTGRSRAGRRPELTASIEPFRVPCESARSMRISIASLASVRPYGCTRSCSCTRRSLLYVDGSSAAEGRPARSSVSSRSACSPRARVASAPPSDWQALICVPVATLVRDLRLADLGRIPLPAPQHPALRATRPRARLRLRDHCGHPAARAAGTRKRFAHLVLGLATAWTVAGVTVLPLTGHRLDLLGATLWPLFAWCILRSRRSHDVRGDLDRDRHARDRRHARRSVDVGRA